MLTFGVLTNIINISCDFGGVKYMFPCVSMYLPFKKDDTTTKIVVNSSQNVTRGSCGLSLSILQTAEFPEIYRA